MHSAPASRVRLGLYALVVAALLFLVGILLRGAIVDPTADPTGFAREAAASSTVSAWTLILAGGIVCLFGLIGLYGRLASTAHERLAFAGFVLSFAGLALVLPLFGFMAMAAPHIGTVYAPGQEAVMNVATGYFTGTLSLGVLMAASLLYVAGSICTALVIWRGEQAPWWVAAAFVLQAPLLTFPVNLWLEILGAVLLLIVGGYFARAAEPQPVSAAVEAAPASIEP